MPSFSEQSKARLYTCHPALIEVCNAVIKDIDITVLEGFRDEATQNRAYALGNSTKRWPESKHNTLPSLAVDIAPYPVDWEDYYRWRMFGGYVLWRAEHMGIKLRWGGDWDDDGDIWDHRFVDMPHFELVGHNA